MTDGRPPLEGDHWTLQIAEEAFVAVPNAKFMSEPRFGSTLKAIYEPGSRVVVLHIREEWVHVIRQGKLSFTLIANLCRKYGGASSLVDAHRTTLSNANPHPYAPSASTHPYVQTGPRGGHFVRTSSGGKRYV